MRPEVMGLIAGDGSLPPLLISKWREQNLDPVVIALDGFANPDIYNGLTGKTIPLGAAGQMISFLKENGVTDLVVAGRVSRPDFMKLKPDPRGMMIITKIALMKNIGDDALLRVIRAEIEKEGIKVCAIQEFLPEVLTPEGLLTKTTPLPEDKTSIEMGFQAARDHGAKDLGQSVVIQQENIIGFEGEKGTNALIRQSGKGKQIGRGPILVKTCKPQQDKALDLPTAGLSTVKEAQAAGFCGIVLQAKETILLDRDEVIEFCDAHNMFLLGKSA